MKRYTKPLSVLLSLLPYLTVFIFALYNPSDPDLGWHLKYGEYFFQHGSVLRDNTFSTMMPDYRWANTSWLTDVLSYAAYVSGGFLGLTLISSLVVTMTFFFFSRAAKLSLWDQAFLFPLLLYVEQPINSVSFRGQLISLMLLGVLFYIVTLYPKRPKLLLLTIPLLLLWANLHGQFIFGLGLFAGWACLYILQKIILGTVNGTPNRVIPVKTGIQSKKNSLLPGSRIKSGMTKLIVSIKENMKEAGYLFGIVLAAGLATFINPFGAGIHLAALSHFGSPLLKSIAEYLPFDLLSQPWWNQVIVGIAIALGFIFLYFRKQLSTQIPLLGVSLIVYILSFGVRRYAWPAYYMILPMLKPLPEFIKPDSKRVTTIMTAVFLLVLFGLAVSSRYPFTQYAAYNWETYCKSTTINCSPDSARFMVENKLTNNVYTLYGWGGWLIWQYPQIKPSIDGRMHLWKDEKGYSGFVEYYAYEQNNEDINKSKYDIVYISTDKPLYNRMLDLVNAGRWEHVYEDEKAGVFVREKK